MTLRRLWIRLNIAPKTQKRNFTIIAVAEGAFSQEESKMKRKDRLKARQEKGYASVAYQLADLIESRPVWSLA